MQLFNMIGSLIKDPLLAINSCSNPIAFHECTLCLVFAGSQEVTTTDDKVTSEQDEVTPNYCSGFRDCIKEVFHCLTNVEAMDLQQSCFRRLMVHLQHELQLISGNVERSKLDSNNHKTVQGKNHHIPYNGGGDKLSSLKLPSHALSCKRSHETSNSAAEPCSSENLMSKRMRQEISFGKNGSGH